MEEIDAAVAVGALRDRFGVVRLGFDAVLGVGSAVASHHVLIDAGSVQVAHDEAAAEAFRERVGVVNAQPAVGSLLVRLRHDRREGVRHRRVGAALALVVAALGHVEQVVDDAAGDEPIALAVEVQAPRVARAFGKQLELSGERVIAPDAASKVVHLAVAGALDARVVEDAVHPVEPAVRPQVRLLGSSWRSSRPKPVRMTSSLSQWPSPLVSWRNSTSGELVT